MGREDFIEKVVEIETKYHNHEISKRLMEYCDLLLLRPEFEKKAKKHNARIVDNYSEAELSNSEVEEAIDLYVANIGTKEERMARSFVWGLCKPLVLGSYLEMMQLYVSNSAFSNDITGFEDTYINLAFEQFCDILQKHTRKLISGAYGGRKGSFKYIFWIRLRFNVFENFIYDVFGVQRGYLTKAEREYKKAREEFCWKRGYEPSVREMAEYTGMQLETVKKYERILWKEYISIDSKDPIRKTYDTKRNHLEGEDVDLNIAELMDNVEIRVMISMILTGKHLLIVKYKYGINEKNEVYTLRKISAELGISLYYVRKMLKEAHDILKPHLREYVSSCV